MADEPGNPQQLAPDPKARIMVEVPQPAALLLVNDADYLETSTALTVPHQALGPLRLLVGISGPDWGSEGRVYRVEFRREQAEALLSFCAEAAEVLKSFPDQPDQDHGRALDSAARAFKFALNVSTTEPP